MTVYTDWLRDFSARCGDLLSKLGPGSREINREITLMLCVGSILLNVPLERLKMRKDQLGRPIVHPQGDAGLMKNEALIKTFDELLRQKFSVSSILFEGIMLKDCWWGGNLIADKRHIPAHPGKWFRPEDPEEKTEWQMPADWTVDMVLSIVRNACAHAHVIVRGSPAGTGPLEDGPDNSEKAEAIGHLLFLSERNPRLSLLNREELDNFAEKLGKSPIQEYRFVAATPRAFAVLLERWMALLPSIDPLGDPAHGEVTPHINGSFSPLYE